MVVSKYAFSDIPDYDASRVAAQIVSGIGFLGAGMIIYRRQAVHGLTTAAGVWATAGVGMAAGGGLYLVSAGATAILIAVQCILHLKCKLFTMKKYIRLRVCFEDDRGENGNKVTELFGVERFSKLNAERRNGQIICTGTVMMNKDISAAKSGKFWRKTNIFNPSSAVTTNRRIGKSLFRRKQIKFQKEFPLMRCIALATV